MARATAKSKNHSAISPAERRKVKEQVRVACTERINAGGVPSEGWLRHKFPWVGVTVTVNLRDELRRDGLIPEWEQRSLAGRPMPKGFRCETAEEQAEAEKMRDVIYEEKRARGEQRVTYRSIYYDREHRVAVDRWQPSENGGAS